MDNRTYSQQEVDRIVYARWKRERERWSRELENRMKRCMASIHLMLHQEMCAMKREAATPNDDPLDLPQ